MGRVRLWALLLSAVFIAGILLRMWRADEPLVLILLGVAVFLAVGVGTFLLAVVIQERGGWEPTQRMLTIALVGGILTAGIGHWLWSGTVTGVLRVGVATRWLSVILEGVGAAFLLWAVSLRNQQDDHQSTRVP